MKNKNDESERIKKTDCEKEVRNQTVELVHDNTVNKKKIQEGTSFSLGFLPGKVQRKSNEQIYVAHVICTVHFLPIFLFGLFFLVR